MVNIINLDGVVEIIETDGTITDALAAGYYYARTFGGAAPTLVAIYKNMATLPDQLVWRMDYTLFTIAGIPPSSAIDAATKLNDWLIIATSLLEQTDTTNSAAITIGNNVTRFYIDPVAALDKEIDPPLAPSPGVPIMIGFGDTNIPPGDTVVNNLTWGAGWGTFGGIIPPDTANSGNMITVVLRSNGTWYIVSVY